MLKPNDFSNSFIGGTWQPAASGKHFKLYNPATSTVLAEVADNSAEDAELAVLKAHEALSHWKSQTAKQRAQVLFRWYELIVDNLESLATLMTLESGKPINESRGEVLYAASFVQWFSEEAKRVRGETIPHSSNDRRIILQKQPVGVCTAITPWNFPLAMITRKCAPAMAAGCSVVVKPAESTPLSALALAKLAEQAEFPKGVFNVVTASKGHEVGEVLTTHPLVKKISFTGSTTVGKLLLSQAAKTVKRVSMELGGNAPFIVFDDADLDKAVEGAMASKYRNTGQTCVCANRFIVHGDIIEEFSKRLAQKTKSLIVGPGIEESTTQGPLINKAAFEKVGTLVQDAIQNGATPITGGQPHELGGLYYEPTVLTNVDMSMRIANEEIFGPVAAIYSFKTEQEAIQMANNTPYGLSAYFYTENLSRIIRVMESLEYGMVGVNEAILSSEMVPFGGVKESGLGREGSHLGIEEYLETKYVCIGGLI